jgi:hypothetical protein
MLGHFNIQLYLPMCSYVFSIHIIIIEEVIFIFMLILLLLLGALLIVIEEFLPIVAIRHIKVNSISVSIIDIECYQLDLQRLGIELCC